MGLLAQIRELGIAPTTKTHIAVMDAYIWHGQLARARRYLHNLIGQAGMLSDAVLFKPFVAAYARAGDAPGVQAVIEGMRNAGCIGIG
jgi:hypothetical protein